MDFFAHWKTDPLGNTITQTVSEHCRNAAQYAARCLSDIGLERSGYLSALVHDAGKFSSAFQSYLLHGVGTRGSVNHSFAGCRLLLERYHGERSEQLQDLTSELLAFAAGAHHGLFDCVDEKKVSGFLHRMTKTGINYQESRSAFLSQCAGPEELDRLFAEANQEITAIRDIFYTLAEQSCDESGAELSFYSGLLARLLLSAVIEGDRRDTAEFMSEAVFPHEPEDPALFWLDLLRHVEEKISALPQETELQRARGAISQRCRAFAESPGGVYRLSVPTGSGKTLSSLRFALAHAAAHHKRRIIFTAPLLTILDQNVQVIRSFIGNDELILEHHSNLVKPEHLDDELHPLELAEENWSAPVIVTTLVQLLNTLFDGRTSSIRRFQALCSSVLVIDEVQTVPTHMLTLFNLAINFLSSVCGTTVVLCSATQPFLERTGHPICPEPTDMIPFDESLRRPFLRTNILDSNKMDLEELAGFSRKLLQTARSLLIVCNKRDEALALYHFLSQDIPVCYHLSASMCPAHRRKVLADLQQALNDGLQAVCVSTQVIEAGVDISFDRVIRLTAGMDSIIQSAGRCNRNGESSDPSPVYIVELKGEDLRKLPDIQRCKEASLALLEAFRLNPARFGSDLSSDASIKFYYNFLYQNHPEGFRDFSTKEHGTIFSLLSGNTKYFDVTAPFFGCYTLNQAFKLAGSLFHVFDDQTEDVVVPYGNGAALINELFAQGPTPSVSYLKHWLKQAKPYTISLYDYQRKSLGEALMTHNGITVLSPGFYHEHTGLSLTGQSFGLLEVQDEKYRISKHR